MVPEVMRSFITAGRSVYLRRNSYVPCWAKIAKLRLRCQPFGDGADRPWKQPCAQTSLLQRMRGNGSSPNRIPTLVPMSYNECHKWRTLARSRTRGKTILLHLVSVCLCVCLCMVRSWFGSNTGNDEGASPPATVMSDSVYTYILNTW